MSSILITGAADGLGRAMQLALQADGHTVASFDLLDGFDVCAPDIGEIYGALREVSGDFDTDIPALDILINCAGVNLTGWLEDFAEVHWDKVMDTNAKGIYMMTRACLRALVHSRGTVLNIVSNASHMPMTTSLAYNASKGAAHIMTLQLARELTKRHNITVFGISPNKLRGTGMSKDIEAQVVLHRGWTPEFAAEYQRNALLCGEETDPAQLAEFVAYLLSSKNRHKFLSGCVIPYGA